MSANLHAGMQSAKKVVFSSPGLVDFAVGLAYFVFPLPNRLVKFMGIYLRKLNIQKYC